MARLRTIASWYPSGVNMPTNEAYKSRIFNIAFSVGSASLNRLVKTLTEVAPLGRIEVKFGDDVYVKYSLEDLLTLPNPSERAIVALYFETEFMPDGSRAKVTLRDEYGGSAIDYTVQGEQQKVVYSCSQLDDWVASVRRWWSISLQTVATTLMCLSSVSAVIAGFGLYRILHGHALSWAIHISYAFSTALTMLATAVLVIKRLRDKVFPLGMFAIGAGIEREKSAAFYRQTLFGTVLLGLAVSIAATIITANLSR